MSISRYAFTPRLDSNTVATYDASSRIYIACVRGIIPCTSYTLRVGERLDHIAARSFGDEKLWWIIAAASGIGWALQVTPGTLLRIPQNLNMILTLIQQR